MATQKHIDRICALAAVAAVLIALLLPAGTVRAGGVDMDYAQRLFDTSVVHTIDIQIDDWDAFLETAQSEEYTVCDVVIDGEKFSAVGIRGKGNTSLSSVASMDSDRYSFKLEFDQYDDSLSYYGLDKLSLNNLIQDNTMMKDYLVYQMMKEFGAASPLCSYVYITVNGEDWGLYLAVEAVEESFLLRNYGSGYGELYKPDSMELGGGRGNGMDFDFSEAETLFEEGTTPTMPEGFDPSQMAGIFPGGTQSQSGGVDPAQVEGVTPPTGGSAEQAEVPDGFDPGQMMGMMPGADMESAGGRGQMSGTAMGSGDAKLQYIDDDPESYSTIFDSAKTDVTEADQARLIASLKTLSEGTDVEGVVDTEAVLKYFVVHNFVVNGDSYTGSMIHNYYLYEEDGKLRMLPWDYNLAFGTFQGNEASSAVNDDIDAPLSVTGSDRPMIDWIFQSAEYTQLYHQYFAEFLETVDAAAIIGQAYGLIEPYVSRDPTKFCTYSEFVQGVSTLKSFCALRAESVAQQLAGETGSVDASGITLSDMGTMGGSMGGGRGQMPGTQGTQTAPTGFPTEQTAPAETGEAQTGASSGAESSSRLEGRQFDRSQLPGMGTGSAAGSSGAGEWILLAVSMVVLLGGLAFAWRFRR